MQCKFCKQYDNEKYMHWVIRKGKPREKEWFHLECYKKAGQQNDNKQQSH